MGQVALSLNGRSYSLFCGDGEEERLRALGTHVQDKIDGIVRDFGQAGEARLFLMTALMIADELFDSRADRDTAASTAAAAALREVAERAKQPAPANPAEAKSEPRREITGSVAAQPSSAAASSAPVPQKVPLPSNQTPAALRKAE